jgi:hypothetical protein
MNKKTILFHNIKKYITNTETYNILAKSYLNDEYEIFLENIYELQIAIIEEFAFRINTLFDEINYIINKINNLKSEIQNDAYQNILTINDLTIKNEQLTKELQYYKRFNKN